MDNIYMHDFSAMLYAGIGLLWSIKPGVLEPGFKFSLYFFSGNISR